VASVLFAVLVAVAGLLLVSLVALVPIAGLAVAVAGAIG